VSQGNASHHAPPPLVALAAWVFPGLGYWLIGHRARALTLCITVIALFLLGILIAGIRVIDVPGYNDHGQRVMLDAAGNAVPDGFGSRERWALTKRPFTEITNKPWFVGQVLVGPIALVAANLSLRAAEPPNPGNINSTVPKSHARLWEIGMLYTAVAGMLNLLAMIDSSYRAGRYANVQTETPAPAAPPAPPSQQQGAA
jgi:hypothetical protein